MVKSLVLNKFFLHHTAKSGQETWRCINSKCKSKIYTNNTEDEINEKILVLNHNQDEDTSLNRQEVNNLLKRNVSADNIVDKLSKFILIEIKKFNNENSLNTTDLHYIRRNVYNARRSILSHLPTSVDDVFDTINLMNIKTNRSEQFVLLNYKDTHVSHYNIFWCNQFKISLFCRKNIRKRYLQLLYKIFCLVIYHS